MKKIKLLLPALALGVFFALWHGSTALAATKTWTGGGADAKVSTGGNWGGSAPSAGDDLVFPITATNKTVNNDMTAGTSFNSITFSGTASTSGGYTVSGNAIALVAGLTDSVSGTQVVITTVSLPIALSSTQTFSVTNENFLTLSGVISGSGNLTLSGGGNFISLSGVNTYTGTTTISTPVSISETSGLGASSSGTTVNAGGLVSYGVSNKNGTIAEPLTLNTGTYLTTQGVLRVDATCGFSYCDDSNITMSGALVLGADVLVDVSGKATFTGALSGAHTIKLTSGSSGALVLNGATNTTQTANGTYGAGAGTTTTYEGDHTTEGIAVSNSNTAIVNGNYGGVTVISGGTLKGTGSMTYMSVLTGGIVAPGLSPGCLTTAGLSLTGTYQAELGGTTACTQYDQIKVTSTATTIDITDATLQVSLYNSFKPTKGQSFTLIDNATALPVVGTFTGMAEGATFTASGYVYKISYVGGTGNDVVITVQSVPNTPNTGFTLIRSNPIVSAIAIMGAALGIAFIAQRGQHSKLARRKR